MGKQPKGASQGISSDSKNGRFGAAEDLREGVRGEVSRSVFENGQTSRDALWRQSWAALGRGMQGCYFSENFGAVG